jgi:hypothetical protein
MLEKEKWLGYEQDKWSGKKHPKSFFPNSIEKFRVDTVVDTTSAESTTIFFEYNDKTGKVYRINNEGVLNSKHIIVRLRNRKSNSSWTREYVISPNKDGDDRTIIDLPMSVSDFLLLSKEGQVVLDDETTITIKVGDI